FFFDEDLHQIARITFTIRVMHGMRCIELALLHHWHQPANAIILLQAPGDLGHGETVILSLLQLQQILDGSHHAASFISPIKRFPLAMERHNPSPTCREIQSVPDPVKPVILTVCPEADNPYRCEIVIWTLLSGRVNE